MGNCCGPPFRSIHVFVRLGTHVIQTHGEDPAGASPTPVLEVDELRQDDPQVRRWPQEDDEPPPPRAWPEPTRRQGWTAVELGEASRLTLRGWMHWRMQADSYYCWFVPEDEWVAFAEEDATVDDARIPEPQFVQQFVPNHSNFAPGADASTYPVG